jgi:O-antigen/teichoic acid export membrane protein
MVILLIINATLNYFLIPKYGATGAAIATCFSMSLINIINIIQNKILLDVFPYDKKNVYMILLGLGLFFIDIYLYKLIGFNNIFIKMFITLVLNYFVYVSLFSFISRSEIKNILYSIKNK